MKRDWELVRQILLALEGLGDSNGVVTAGDIKGYDAENVNYHMRLLNEAGLIQADVMEPLGASVTCFANRLTWEGHQFLDNIRDNTLWNRVKATIREKGLEISFDTIKFAAPTVLRKMLQG